MASFGLALTSSRSLRLLFGVVPRNSRAVHTTAAALGNKPIHTGQSFVEEDYRNARFEITPRQTNDRWAINLIKEVPPKGVNARVVACDGGPGALGHPRVYINLDEPGNQSCIYCGLRFYKEDSH
ncbi:NADH dehydrogenase [ubiquinone] iron-sulfur protein 6, mitochondrial-like [Homarus americanus]|uniref:NADH dehydrogenase [ubiquinone] iron-sulfur protein 6, mitochondrial-like n=1 Tax=Homarus americanus TaxID=6706 RepID=UPI001C46FEB9|nr:NADH dehydrogenase [ubiquinone] iron-sulfur protein 6, mitochondrial-like [Homarus americanus]